MNCYSQAIRLIKSDFNRYHSLSKQGKWRFLIRLLIHDSGFKFLIWFRLTAAKGPLFLFNWLMYMHYSRKYLPPEGLNFLSPRFSQVYM